MSSPIPAPNADAGIDVFAVVVQALAEQCDVPPDAVTPESNLADDFGLDSLAFIDLCFALDTKLKIKIPFELCSTTSILACSMPRRRS